jgi:hypothetical protein
VKRRIRLRINVISRIRQRDKADQDPHQFADDKPKRMEY